MISYVLDMKLFQRFGLFTGPTVTDDSLLKRCFVWKTNSIYLRDFIYAYLRKNSLISNELLIYFFAATNHFWSSV